MLADMEVRYVYKLHVFHDLPFLHIFTEPVAMIDVHD